MEAKLAGNNPIFSPSRLYQKGYLYNKNTIEAINRQIREIIKTKGCFPNDEAVFKLVVLALQNAQKKWTMPIRDWKLALNQFCILFGEFTQSL
jgi:putative transposase